MTHTEGSEQCKMRNENGKNNKKRTDAKCGNATKEEDTLPQKREGSTRSKSYCETGTFVT